MQLLEKVVLAMNLKASTDRVTIHHTWMCLIETTSHIYQVQLRFFFMLAVNLTEYIIGLIPSSSRFNSSFNLS